MHAHSFIHSWLHKPRHTQHNPYLGENVERCTIGSKKGKIANFWFVEKHQFQIKALHVSFKMHPIILGFSRRFRVYSKLNGTMSHRWTSLILKSRFLVLSIGDHILAICCNWICLLLYWVWTFKFKEEISDSALKLNQNVCFSHKYSSFTKPFLHFPLILRKHITSGCYSSMLYKMG